ncbi:MAG: hypothetical protein ACKVP5_17985 [Aestuariivirga sp.]
MASLGALIVQISEGEKNLWDLFEIYRAYIIHEDELISGRLGRYFSVQSVLFGGYAALNIESLKELKSLQFQQTMQSVILDGSNIGYDDVLAGLVATFGIISAATSMSSLLAARNAIDALRDKWEGQILGAKDAKHPRLPDITGGGAKYAHRNGMRLALALPPLTILVWLVIVFCHYALLD